MKPGFKKNKGNMKGIFILKSYYLLTIFNCKVSIESNILPFTFSNDMACLSKNLTIVDIKEEDLLLKYDCFALNTFGRRTHTIGLKKKQSKDC